jgi:hypothetical protein
VRCEGVSKVYVRRSDSGREVHHHFCPECGTTVYSFAERAPGLCAISVGCFADADFPAPSFSLQDLHPIMQEAIAEREDARNAGPGRSDQDRGDPNDGLARALAASNRAFLRRG